jgi:predicted O-methyltransferase YrrM
MSAHSVQFSMLHCRSILVLREVAIAARNFVLGGNLKTLAFLSRPREGVAYVGECLFLERMINVNGDLPQRQVWEVLNTTSDIPVALHPIGLKDWFTQVASWQADLIALCMLCRLAKPKRIFEIGTLHGSSALHMALNAPEAEIVTLDLEGPARLQTTAVDRHYAVEGQRRKLIFEGLPEERRIKSLHGDSAVFDYSPFENSIDFFFVDGAHSYEYVKADTLNALRCTREGGIIAWHDYGRCGVNGVSKWLNEFRARGNEVQRIPGGSLAYMINRNR